MKDNDPIAMLLVLLALYFLPSVIAAVRGHPNGAAIGIVNTFLGWTLIGWVWALAWSVTAIDAPAGKSAGLATTDDGTAAPATDPALSPSAPERTGTAITPTEVAFDYLDARGDASRRTATVQAIECDAAGTPVRIAGHCHMRDAPRSFRVERIAAVIADDGAPLDPQDYFEDLLDARSEG